MTHDLSMLTLESPQRARTTADAGTATEARRTPPAAAAQSGADHLISALLAEGVSCVFAHAGKSAEPLFALLGQSSIKNIVVRHEQSAAHAADGFARASGQVGVCLITAGAGTTNALTGIETAHLDSIPMVVLVIQAPVLTAIDGVDTLGLTRSCVKHSLALTDPQALGAVMKKAFFLARSGRPGPVLVEFTAAALRTRMPGAFSSPRDVPIRGYRSSWPIPRHPLAAAADALRHAKRPLIYYGGGVVLGNAHRELRALAELTGAPVTSTLMGLGAFDATHPQFLGMLGMHGTYEANLAMQHCDVLVAVGARFDDRVIGDPDDFAKPHRRIIHIDIDPTSISKRVAVDFPIVGECGLVLDALVSLLRDTGFAPGGDAGWWQQISTWRAAKCLSYPNGGPAIKPQRVIEALSALPGSDDFIVCSDVGQHQMWTAQHFSFRAPRRWINSGGLGTMGFGLPAAIGAALAWPGKTVVCITGDGSIQMSSKELMTCLQYRLPIKIICLNNSQLGMVRQQQDFYHDRRRSHSYMEALPDFVQLAQAYGHRGQRISTNEELDAGLDEIISDPDHLCFIDVLVDRTENVYPTLAPGRPLTDMMLRSPIAAEEL